MSQRVVALLGQSAPLGPSQTLRDADLHTKVLNHRGLPTDSFSNARPTTLGLTCSLHRSSSPASKRLANPRSLDPDQRASGSTLAGRHESVVTPQYGSCRPASAQPMRRECGRRTPCQLGGRHLGGDLGGGGDGLIDHIVGMDRRHEDGLVRAGRQRDAALEHSVEQCRVLAVVGSS